MECPKCGYENPSNRQDCRQCGVIFARIRQASLEKTPVIQESRTTAWRELLLATSEQTGEWSLWGKAMILLVLTAWGGWLIVSGITENASGESWLHMVNLPFHGAGHVFFRPFGSFITSLGGTLGQLLMPFICLAVLLIKTGDPFGAAVCLWWFGENFLDIAPYINDARAGELPLVGGNFGHSSPYGFHDWEYLLTESGLLRHDHVLASIAHIFGSLVMALAVVWGAAVIWAGLRRVRS